MFRINQSQQIIIFFLALFLISSIYLFGIDSRYKNPKYNTDWYAISFVDSRSDNLDFVIENFSKETTFHWELLEDKKIIFQDYAEIKSGEKKELNSPKKLSDKKITIRVSAGDNTQEIYKNIAN